MQKLRHEFGLNIKDNKLKAVMGTTMFRTRTVKNQKAYNRKLKHKSEGWEV